MDSMEFFVHSPSFMTNRPASAGTDGSTVAVIICESSQTAYIVSKSAFLYDSHVFDAVYSRSILFIVCERLLRIGLCMRNGARHS